jgi:hypothetical protein
LAKTTQNQVKMKDTMVKKASPTLWLVIINLYFCIRLVLQWLIMRLQAKSVERGWEKLMRRVALMPTLQKGRC